MGGFIIGIILFIIVFITQKNKQLPYENHKPEILFDSLMKSCYDGGGEPEFGERMIAYKWTSPDATVLEFEGGAGSVSNVVQSILKNKKNHVVIQPNENGMFGGLTQLKKNKKKCDSKFHIIDRYLKKGMRSPF